MKARIYIRCAYTNYANANRYQLKVFEWLSKLPYQPGVLWTPSVERSKFNGPSPSLYRRAIESTEKKRERERERERGGGRVRKCSDVLRPPAKKSYRGKKNLIARAENPASSSPLSVSLSLSHPPPFFRATAIYASGVICVVHKKRFEFFALGHLEPSVKIRETLPETARENFSLSREGEREKERERKRTRTLFIPQRAARGRGGAIKGRGEASVSTKARDLIVKDAQSFPALYRARIIKIAHSSSFESESWELSINRRCIVARVSATRLSYLSEITLIVLNVGQSLAIRLRSALAFPLAFSFPSLPYVRDLPGL